MNFNLQFQVTEGSCCKTATLCDTTCLINHYNKYTCCDGYGVEGNISREDISYTRFHWKFPDGNEYLNVNQHWVPGTRAKAVFDVPSGTNGVIVVDVDGLVIGQTVFITDIATTRATLIQSINSIASQTGWQAYEDPNQADRIIIESIYLGNEYNGKNVTFTVSGDIVATTVQNPTSGANGNTDCIEFTVPDIVGSDCPPSEFMDGAYEITYILYNDNDEEIGRAKCHVLFTCLLDCILKKLILLPAEDKCVCSDKFDERLVELRLMKEKAEIQFDDCLYDCANDTIKKAHKFAEGICLDC